MILYSCATCDDNTKNGNEIGVDCGGDCPACQSCFDNERNGNELGIDCGGGDCPDCFPVDIDKELLIRDISIVDNISAISGTLSFGKMITRLSNSETQSIELISSFINSWSDTSVINDIKIAPRPNTRNTILGLWDSIDSSAVANNNLVSFNDSLTPFRLLSINSRFDLADFDSGKVGEGRLTYGLTSGTSQFTLIFECNLEGDSESDRISWMKRWHQLSGMEQTSKKYLDTLEAIVTTFSKSSMQLSQLRTNEFLDGDMWEFREWNILDDGQFSEVTRKASPTTELQGDPLLLEYITVHGSELSSSIIREKFKGVNVLAGNTFYGSNFMWKFDNASDQQLLHVDTLNFISCMSCHGGLAPRTGFTHIKPRQAGVQSRLSGFLIADLDNREAIVRNILDLPSSPASIKDISILEAQSIDSIRILLDKFKNIKRVH